MVFQDFELFPHMTALQNICLAQTKVLERKPSDRHFFPCDSQVSRLYLDGASPLDRAAAVLEHLGIDPFAHDAWVDTIGVDLSRIPIIGTVGENDEVKFKRPGKRVER